MSTQTNTNGNWLTVVYKDIEPGDEAEALIGHAKMSAASWSHALQDRDAAIKQALAQPAPVQPEQEPVDAAYALADKVRTALDKQSCPGVYMDLAWEAVTKNYTAAAPVQEPAGCQHKRSSVDAREGTGTCHDCGAEGRMQFVVGDTSSITRVRELECVIADLTAECKELRAAQPAPVPLTDKKKYRLLNYGEKIESGDTVLDDDCFTWHPITGWEVGMLWGGKFMMPMRRAIEADCIKENT
jgi:hypothetical protein